MLLPNKMIEILGISTSYKSAKTLSIHSYMSTLLCQTVNIKLTVIVRIVDAPSFVR